uniref:sigma factor-like helix-turn-helix DNA-binding protein n=1 Tax=Aeribacillus sp. FSL K6-8210 TaxID=2954683 RepID=UPI00403F3EC2
MENYVRELLRNYHKITERQFKGDYDAIILLADLATAIELADLTDRQRECLRLVYVDGLGENEVARVLGIARNTVNVHLNTACNKIAEVYES